LKKGDGGMSEVKEENLTIEEDTQKGKFFTFSLGKEVYAIEIKYVTEIIGIQPITEVPELPAYLKGIINLRGKIIPVLDVRLRFKKQCIDYNDRTCIVVIEVKNTNVGLIVDNVSEVLSIAEEETVPPPVINKASENKFIQAVGKVGNEVVLILDCDQLINEDDFRECSIVA
jgi:purine-binding chemotaxis protein CheW